jgi:hypothetical protein
MVSIFDDYEPYLEGGYFSSPKKNLGNKLFIYAGCRIIADLLDYNLISPENALIRRENKKTGQYENQTFPFKIVLGRNEVTDQIKLGNIKSAHERCEGLNQEDKLSVWSLLNDKTKLALKKYAEI